MLKPSNLAIDGTSLQGYLTAKYSELVEAFGPPNSQTDEYKVDAEWTLTEGGQVVTIYNWKNGRNYNGPEAPAVEDITDWHIGGLTKNAVDKVKKIFPKAHHGQY
jgi:hypothetical protein